MGLLVYSYCFNNPLKYSDPTGYSAWDDPYNAHSVAELWAREHHGQDIRNTLEPIGGSTYGRNEQPEVVEVEVTDKSGEKKKVLVPAKNLRREFLANYLRNSIMIGPVPNPFLGAEAIMVDFGTTLAGAEGDAGFVFILAGVDKGKLRPYTEIAGGLGSDAGISGEITRIDYLGDISEFSIRSLNGYRDKIYGGLEVTGELVSVGGAVSYGQDLNEGNAGIVVGTAVQFSLGGSLIPFIYGGYNGGNVKVK